VGPTIITQTLLAIIHVVDFRRDPTEALAQPRFHQQWSPDELRIEKKFPAEVRRELERRGHKLRKSMRLGLARLLAGPVTASSSPVLRILESATAAPTAGKGPITGRCVFAKRVR
jgi:gamma-glutamyltranspeptidase/glutathione hydrolase